MDEHELDKHLDNHDEGNNIEEEIEKVAQVVETVHVVGDNESSTDENFDIAQYDNQHDQFEDGS